MARTTRVVVDVGAVATMDTETNPPLNKCVFIKLDEIDTISHC
jgi:hypothetical protein